VYPKSQPTYERQGPITRARVVFYGRTQLEALESARSAGQRFANALPTSVSCRPASYAGFDEEAGRHSAALVVAFGVTDSEVTRQRISEVLDAL